jgi:hypothetical protein
MPRSSALKLSGGLLLAASAWTLGIALTSRPAAPVPDRWAAGIVQTGSATSAMGTTPTMGRSRPIELDIPAIDVHTSVAEVGLNPSGTIEVPHPGPDYDAAAWYRYSPTPGERGPAIIEGHLDTTEGPSVFYRLGALHPGDQVDITRADGRSAIFQITAVRRYAKAAFPTAEVYGDLDHPGLRLITCGGDLDPVTHHYQDNTVVFADLLSTFGAPI